jgi:transposase-like protein
MNIGCPNISCNLYLKNTFQNRDGFYFRRDDSRKIQRYKCKICKTKYSRATFTLEKYQKKRRINLQVRACLSMGVSQRNCAYALKVARKTIERKLIYLSEKAKLNQKKFLDELKLNPINEIQFDDLISSVHTKLKPVSISVVACPKTFSILGAAVSEIPAFGKLAEISRRKYGRRKNFHTKTLDNLMGTLTSYIDPLAEFKTDEHKRYAEIIKKHFPKSKHKAYKSIPATVVGMGELKSKKYDPLFAINHTLACFRYGMNRFIRRTWCTSKKLENIQHHINIFIDFHNEKKRCQN